MSDEKKKPIPRPELISKIGLDVFPAFAMLAGIELDIFTALSEGPRTREEIAGHAGVEPERIQQLLYALAEAGLLTVEEGERFANTAEANIFLVKGRPTYLGVARSFYRTTWNAAMQTTASIRSGKPQVRWMSLSPEEKEAYLDGLRPSARGLAQHMTQLYDLSGVKTLADVAGGSGELAISLARLLPQIEATVIDLPDVVPIARSFIAQAGAADRVKAVTGDVFSGDLAGSYDAVLVRNFLQMLSAEEARLAMKNIAEIVAPGGAVYLAEMTLDDSRQSPAEAVRYGLLFVNMFDNSTSAFTESEYRGFLADAGLVGFSRTPTARGASLMRAEKPA